MGITRKELKKIKPYTPGKPIEEVKRALKLSKVSKLASNEIPVAPLYLRKVVLDELNNINRYPEAGCFYLRKALAKKLKVKDDRIVFGNGSDELITLTLRACVNKGDEVVVAYPTFLIYEIQAKVQGAKVVRVPLKDFRYDLQAMAKKVTKKTKVVFIANPDNPTGTYVTHQEVVRFLKKIPKNVIVFLDEAYYEFGPKNFPRSLELLRKRGNIIIARTFSKAYGLAGLRVGYGIMTKELAKALNTVREPFNVNRMAQVCAVAALKNTAFLKKVLTNINKEKKYLYKELEALNVKFIESATNFITVDFKKDTSKLYEYLLRKGIIVRVMKSWGLKNFFRVTIGQPAENKKFIKHLKEYMKKGAKK